MTRSDWWIVLVLQPAGWDGTGALLNQQPTMDRRDAPVTAPHLISRDVAFVKAHLVKLFEDAVEPVLVDAIGGKLSPRTAELRAWQALIPVGAALLSALFTCLARQEAERVAATMGKRWFEVMWRLEADYFCTVKSTFGVVRHPWFAFRHPETGKTITPARALFPLRQLAHVTEVCLEWECVLAAEHPFRRAAEALGFFTHGAVDIEDNTLERHAVLVGSAIPADWLYRTPADIRSILAKRATRDTRTDEPIVYVSTDAHALRRYVDATWNAKWKMVNGLRMWCIDRDTAEIVHLGGEFMWGHYDDVVRRVRELQAAGIVPVDGNYGDGVTARIAIPTDGLPWIADHFVPLFPTAEAILDPWHVIQQISAAAAAVHPRSRKKRNHLIQRAKKALGIRQRRGRQKIRGGPRKGPKLPKSSRRPVPRGNGARMRQLMAGEQPQPGKHAERYATFMAYADRNLARTRYDTLRDAGFHIGSGAMESVHRSGSQLRLKLPGCRWTPEAALAIMNHRMLRMAGRSQAFWNQPDLMQRIVRHAEAAS